MKHRAGPSWPHQRRPQIGRHVSVAGRSCHVLTRGQGRPVILLHGNGSLGEEILCAFPDVEGVCWIAPDRPGFGLSEAWPEGHHDPLSQAIWLESLMAELEIDQATVVAHSLAAGLALAFASARPAKVMELVLLAPFCRPTPERALPFLRLTAVPVIGRIVRLTILPTLVRLFRKRIIRGFVAPNRPPPWLRGLPLSHAANSRAVGSTVAELLSFNHCMATIENDLRPTVPVRVVWGLSDKTADPGWHLPWMQERIPQLESYFLQGCGHAVHHADPARVLEIVLGTEGNHDAPSLQPDRHPSGSMRPARITDRLASVRVLELGEPAGRAASICGRHKSAGHGRD